MKSILRKARRLAPNRFQKIREDDPDSKLGYAAYISEATGTGFDTRRDRVVEVYRYLREHADPASWHRDDELRKFIGETQDDNPYIPIEVRLREYQSRSRKSSPREFVPAWQAAGLPVREQIIDVEDFEARILTAPEIVDAFKQSNVHDTSYFFTKLGEWYITLAARDELNATSLVDIGAAYHGFAKVAITVNKDVTVSMVDLTFKKGREAFAERIEQIGADAGDMSCIENGSVDLVCAHNAFEHFAGDSDTNCAREIERILKPGGKALISPLFTDEVYSLSINPFSCFVTADGDGQSKAIIDELDEARVRVDFRPNIISPYSRRYDLEALHSRVLNHVETMQACLVIPRFKNSGFIDGVYHRPVFDMELRDSVFHERAFHCLELTKPEI